MTLAAISKAGLSKGAMPVLSSFLIRLRSSSYIQDAARLSLGTGLGQAIILASSPILARLYSPQDFGVLALFSAWEALVMLLVTGKFEQAIILENDDGYAWTLCQLVIGFGCAVGLVLAPLLWIFKTEIAGWLGSPLMELWLPWVPIFSLLGGAALAGYYWSLRLRRFDRAGSSELASRLTQTGTSVTLGVFPLAGVPAGGLVLALAASQMTKAALTLPLRPPSWRGYQNGNLISRLIVVFSRHWRLCFSLIGSQGLSVGANNLLIFSLGALYGDARLGLYALAARVVAAPSALIANAIGDVYRQRAAERYREIGRFDDVMRSTLKKTLGLSIIPYTLAIIIAPWLFEFIFGEIWREAGELARILLVSGFFSFVITPIDKAAIIVGARVYILSWHAVRLAALGIIFLAALHAKLNIYFFLWLVTIIQIFLYLVELCYASKFAKGVRRGNGT